jgi:hypothetical protein
MLSYGTFLQITAGQVAAAGRRELSVRGGASCAPVRPKVGTLLLGAAGSVKCYADEKQHHSKHDDTD